jgi:hypothetical protein
MKKWLIQTVLTAAVLFLACWYLPRSTSVLAYIVQYSQAFGFALIFSFVICKKAGLSWWAQHIQLRGVGGKSRWQLQQRGKK